MCAAPYSRAGLTVDHIFNHNALQLNSFTDAMIVVAFIVNSVAMAVALRYIVARAKKCLDYGATIYCLHLAACWALRALPTNPVWWAVIAACAAVTVLLGELLCVRFEMMDIPIGGAHLPPLPQPPCCALFHPRCALSNTLF